jgi:hypothetical protein
MFIDQTASTASCPETKAMAAERILPPTRKFSMYSSIALVSGPDMEQSRPPRGCSVQEKVSGAVIWSMWRERSSAGLLKTSPRSRLLRGNGGEIRGFFQEDVPGQAGLT